MTESKEHKEHVKPEIDAIISNIINKDISEEMKSSYIDYSMSVIVGRALPDVRDGLKPVHRRILYTMDEMGLKHNKPYKKSARVVGECFVKDTLVVTNKGLTPIQDIKIGDFVYTQNGLEKVTELYEMPERELLKVTLENGSYNIVTKSQMFKVIDENLKFKWKEAKDLTENDYIITRSVFPDIKEYLPLPRLDGKSLCLNRNLGYLLGQLVSDGWVERGYNHGKGSRIGFCSSSSEVIKKIQTILKEEFGYKSTIEEKKSKDNSKFKQLYFIRMNSLEINNFIISVFGLENVYANTKFIPSQIFNSPKEVIFSFISGLIDGDGSIHKNRNIIYYGSTSEKLIDGLMLLLQCFGIIGKKYSDSNIVGKGEICGREVKAQHPFYSLEITGRNAVLLGSLLHLVDIRKNMAIKRIIFNKINNPIKFDVIPFAGKKIFEELSQFHIGSGWYLGTDGKKFRMGIKYPVGCKIRYSQNLKEKNLGKGQIENWQIRNKLNKLGAPLAGFINEVFQDGLNFIRVKKIENVSRDITFDIQVENAHEFIANGMISHNCLGKYHPHGDMAVYDSLVRMAQPFSLRIPLVDGQGNFGSIDGDSAAAMRYTEVRLAQISDEMLSDIEKETVKFGPNYDGSLKEPLVLPAKLPNLLVNGSSGIAVGMATNIPTHNLSEVCDASIAVINNPEIQTKELMKLIKGPDFPTGAIIRGRQGIKDYFETGRGSIKIQAKAEIEDIKGGRQAIIVSEIPYQVNKSVLIESIADLVRNKKISDISDIRDESDRRGMRIVIEIKRDGNAQVVLNQLYKHTQMETSFGVIMLAIVDGKPKVLSLKEVIQQHIKHRKAVVTARTKYDLNKAQQRAHILEGFLIAIKNLDAVIAIIKKSKDAQEAKQKLINQFALTEIQAQAILDMRLHQLTRLEVGQIEEEYKGLLKLIEEFKGILADPKKVLKIIIKEFEELKSKYGEERKTQITAEASELSIEDLIPEEKVVITMSHGGYIKRIPADTYRVQGRGGKGVIGSDVKDEDFIEHLFVTSSHATILLFTSRGKVYPLKGYEIPEGTRASRGKAVINLLPVKDEKITSVIDIESFEEAKGKETFIVMCTRKGKIKKTPIKNFANIRKSGIIAIGLEDGDVLTGVGHTNGKYEIMIGTKNGMSIRFPESNIRAMGRGAKGVRGIKLDKNDQVVGMEVIESAKGKTLLTVCENGYGKRTDLDEYRNQRRGGIGVITIKATERNGNVVGIKLVSDDDHLIVITEQGKIIRMSCKDISTISRNTQGVRLVKLEEGDKIASIEPIVEENGNGQTTEGRI